MHVSIRIQEADFSVADENRGLRERMSGKIGAIVNFIGLVRDQQADDEVLSLKIEHYPGIKTR